MRSLKVLIILSLFLAAALLSSRAAESYRGMARFSPADLVIGRNAGYDTVALKRAGALTRPGCPSLPVVQVDVALPPGARVAGVSLLGAEYTLLDGVFDVIPFARPRRIGNPAMGDPFIKDAAVYGTDALFPGEGVDTAGTWDLAGQMFVTVDLYPVQYNPATGKLYLATSLAYEVSYDANPGNQGPGYNFSPRVREHYLGLLRRMAVNPEDVSIPKWTGGGSRSLPAGDYEYVIITTSSFESSFFNLAEYYTRIGIPAKIVTLTSIYSAYSGSTDQAKIRSFIMDANATWGAVFFLLGGDKGKVPCHTRSMSGDSIPNDTYYADYDGDWKIEVYVGRASADTTSEVDTFVDKTIDYMMSPPASFGGEVFQMGFDLDSSTKSEKLMQYIYNNWVPSWAIYDSEYDSEAGRHKSDCRNYINSGHSVTNHSDHANWNIIGVGSYRHGDTFGNSDASNFSNGDRAGIFYTLGCLAGAFDYNDCFVENLAKNPGGGSVASVGNGRYGWYSPGSTDYYSCKYDKKFFKALWDENHYRAGETLGESKNDYYPGDSTYKYIFTELNLFGDPAMPIWTAVPGVYTVDFQISIPTGGQNFTVTVKAGGNNAYGALVCLYKGSQSAKEVYARKTTGFNGQASFTIDPKTAGTMYVTVSGQNMRPCFESCTVTAGPPPDLDVELELNKKNYARGQTIYYRVSLTNNTQSVKNTQVWTNVTLWTGGVFPASGHLDGPLAVTINPGETKSKILSIGIPWNAPMNDYVFNAYCGQNPGIDDEDHVPFSIPW